MKINEMKQISIDFSDSVMSVQSAKDGNREVKKADTTKDCVVQKEMDRSITYTKEQEKVNDKAKAQTNWADVDGKGFLSQSLTGEDVERLDEDKTPMEEYTSEQLDRAIDRVKRQRDETQDSVDRQVTKERDKDEGIKKASVTTAAQGQVPQDVVQRMEVADVPMTEENAVRLSGAASMAQAVDELSTAGQMQVVESGEITPESIGKAAHTTTTKQAPAGGFDDIAGQVADRMTLEGMEPNEENMAVAKKLYEQGMPVTTENIKMYQDLMDVSKLSPEALLDRVVDAMVDGIAPESADLTMISRDEAKVIVNRFENQADYIKAKRQLEESRLQLTIEAARQLTHQGIDIDTSNLEEVVEGLKQLENQAYESLLKENGIEVTETNVQAVSDTLSYLDVIKDAPATVLGTTLENGMAQTIPEFGQAVTEAKQSVDLGAEYEKVGTEVRGDLGDNIKKAFANADSILQELELPVNEANLRAVRILGYNQMPINEESIEQMKAYDSEVNTMLDQMTPTVVCQMVKQGVNPLDMPMSEVTRVATEIAEDLAPDDKDFAKFLWRMDKSGDITEDERESMVGIFRLLNQVEKSDGSAVGALVNSKREITLGTLLSAVRSRKHSDMDVTIDDDFGGLEDVQKSGTAIDEQINSAFLSRQASVLKKVIEPQVLSEENNEANLEQLTTESQKVHDDKMYYEKVAEEIRDTMDSDTNIESYLAKLNLPDSMENRQMVKAYLESGDNKFRRWQSEDDTDIAEAMESREQLERVLEEKDQAYEGQLAAEQGEDNMTYERLTALQLMGRQVHFSRNLRRQQMYEVPVNTAAGVTTLNVTFQKGEDTTSKVDVTMESATLGRIQATFTVSEEKVSGYVTTEQRDTSRQLDEMLQEVTEGLEEKGFTVAAMNTVNGNRQMPVGTTETASDQLYQVAKTYVQSAAHYLQNEAERTMSYED